MPQFSHLLTSVNNRIYLIDPLRELTKTGPVGVSTMPGNGKHSVASITWKVMFPELFSKVCACAGMCVHVHTYACMHMQVLCVCEQNLTISREQVRAKCVMPPVQLYSKSLHGLSRRSFDSNQARADLGGVPSPTCLKKHWASRPGGLWALPSLCTQAWETWHVFTSWLSLRVFLSLCFT